MRQHTAECRAQAARALEAIRVWEEKYPGYCRTCGGAGTISWTENGAPHGAGFWAMPMTEGCDACLVQNRCPRCGFQMLPKDQDVPEPGGEIAGRFRDLPEPCPHCGWWSDDSQPYEWECWGDCVRENEEVTAS